MDAYEPTDERRGMRTSEIVLSWPPDAGVKLAG